MLVAVAVAVVVVGLGSIGERFLGLVELPEQLGELGAAVGSLVAREQKQLLVVPEQGRSLVGRER